jgi:hypothetical protein
LSRRCSTLSVNLNSDSQKKPPGRPGGFFDISILRVALSASSFLDS